MIKTTSLQWLNKEGSLKHCEIGTDFNLH